MHPLIAEAAKKAAVAWLTVPGAGQAYPVWGLWADEAFYVVSGEGEQTAPGLAAVTPGSGAVGVTMKGDHGGRVVTWQASVSVISPTDEAWSTVAPTLAGKRLNASGGAEQTVERWTTTCVVHRLSPMGDPAEAGQSLPAGDLVGTVRLSDAARHPRKPFRLHRIAGQKRSRG
jgi:hypothetical protein